MSPICDADFRCFWVTLSCLATSVFVEKNPKTEKKLKPRVFQPWVQCRFGVVGHAVLRQIVSDVVAT